MYSVALVQNQSEMAHYGYADARPMLKDLAYIVELYTADNIENLQLAFSRNSFDAVIFASNALNDKTILNEVSSESFKYSFNAWLSSGRGKGCLVLLQLKLASSENANLSFLPNQLSQVNAKVRPVNEGAAEGEFNFIGDTESSFMGYPHFVSSESLQQTSLNFKSLPGLYWHYWSDVNPSDWEEFITDETFGEENRSLLLSSRNLPAGRVVLSALPIDWQKQRNLFENIITYVVEGEHKTAFLIDQNNHNIALGYLIGTLKSQRFPYRCYYVNQDLSELSRNLENGVHESLVLAPHVSLAHLTSALCELAKSLVRDGGLKLIVIDEDDDFNRRFSIAGRERTAKSLLSDVEVLIQSEIKHGYIDGSFWSTAETLQVLEGIEESASYSLYVDEILKQADLHDKNGSYDEVFGASCAFTWLRANYLGLNDSKTEESISWIREKISDYEIREQAQAYLIFSKLGILETDEMSKLEIVLSNLNSDSLSEIDCIVFLNCCFVTSSFQSVQTLIGRLEEKQSSNTGAWLDLATTSDAVSALVGLSSQLRKKEPNLYAKLKSRVEQMIFNGIIYIQDALERAPNLSSSSDYPWDGKASTAIKCINAWLLTEELIDFPVQELVDSLRKIENRAVKISSNRRALNVLKELKEENGALKKLEILKEVEASELRKKASKSGFLLMILGFLFYFFCTTIYGIVSSQGSDALLSVIEKGFVDIWGTHLTAIAVIAALLVVPWKNIIGKTYES
ncbi:hypothetical protein [Glaciecola sp. SC05]|uniref:hypothetical protein n=1 Tax=Glaciecola sp. SC05 TaxID=1987355 RepID=UPI003527029B